MCAGLYGHPVVPF